MFFKLRISESKLLPNQKKLLVNVPPSSSEQNPKQEDPNRYLAVCLCF